MTGLEKIISKIDEDTDAECKSLIDEANAEAERIKEDYAAKRDAAIASMNERLEREAESVVARAKSSSAMSRRNIMAGARSRNVDLAYTMALKKIYSSPRESYAELVTSLAVDAIKRHIDAAEERTSRYGESAGSYPFELVFNEHDREEIGEFVVFSIKNNYKCEFKAEELRRVTLAVGSVAIDGGVIVRCGNIEENRTLSLIAESCRTRLDPLVYEALYPEE
ncbi:MAG: V-type ATP synthase subunit E [Firmicutes bacterium]|nr:V-type ATP synthase subunit E [Bacillota bacterium]